MHHDSDPALLATRLKVFSSSGSADCLPFLTCALSWDRPQLLISSINILQPSQLQMSLSVSLCGSNDLLFCCTIFIQLLLLRPRKLILSRISKQNRGLDTSKWRILHRQEKPDGQLLVLGVDDASDGAQEHGWQGSLGTQPSDL